MSDVSEDVYSQNMILIGMLPIRSFFYKGRSSNLSDRQNQIRTLSRSKLLLKDGTKINEESCLIMKTPSLAMMLRSFQDYILMLL